MVFAAIDEKSEEAYTYLKKLFAAIENRQLHMQWLISDISVYTRNAKWRDRLRGDYCWISGQELTELVNESDIQWLFGVFSGFDPAVKLEDVLACPLPYADGYGGFWKLPSSMQHPLAQVEIVPWDGCCTMIFSRDPGIVESFRRGYPGSQSMEEYLEQFSKIQTLP